MADTAAPPTNGFLTAKPPKSSQNSKILGTARSSAVRTPTTPTSTENPVNSFAGTTAPTSSDPSPSPSSFPKFTPFANFTSSASSSPVKGTADAWASAFTQRANAESEAAEATLALSANLENVQTQQRKAMKVLFSDMESEWGIIQLYGQILLQPSYQPSVFDCDQLHEEWIVVIDSLESVAKKEDASAPLLPKWAQDKDVAIKMIDLLIGFRELHDDAFGVFKNRHCMGNLQYTSTSGLDVLTAVEAPLLEFKEQRQKRKDVIESMKAAIASFNTTDAPTNVLKAVENLVVHLLPLQLGEGLDASSSSPVSSNINALHDDIKVMKQFAIANRDIFEAYSAKEGTLHPITVIQAWGS